MSKLRAEAPVWQMPSIPMPIPTSMPRQPGYYMCIFVPAAHPAPQWPEGPVATHPALEWAQSSPASFSEGSVHLEEIVESREYYDFEDGMLVQTGTPPSDLLPFELLETKKTSTSKKSGANKIRVATKSVIGDSEAETVISEDVPVVLLDMLDALLDVPPGLILADEPYRPLSLSQTSVEMEEVLADEEPQEVQEPHSAATSSKHPESWDIEEVVSWIVEMVPSLARCMPKVREHEINGEALVFLKRDELMNELGMPEHECQVILREIQKLFFPFQ